MVWQSYMETLQREFPTGGFGRILLGDANGLFAEACNVYEASAWSATAVLCRAAIEAAGYLYLARVWNPSLRVCFIEPPRDLSGRIRLVTLDEIIRGLDAQGALSPESLRAARRIHEDGNYVAHYAAKQDIALDRDLRRLDSRSPESRTTHPEPVRQWISEARAQRDLKDTAEILLEISRKFGVNASRAEATSKT